MTETEIKRSIDDTYKYRSRFFHEGQPTPHFNPNSEERFIETKIYVKSEKPLKFEAKVLIKHDFLSFIAKMAILNYFKQHSIDETN